MSAIMVDTSVWVDFFHGYQKKGSLKLYEIIESEDIVVPPVIFQEILQGIKDESLVKEVEDYLTAYTLMSYDPYFAAKESAGMYRELRKKGVTISKTNDTLIAWLCLYFNCSLLHNDKDFTQIAKHTNLKIYNSNT